MIFENPEKLQFSRNFKEKTFQLMKNVETIIPFGGQNLSQLLIQAHDSSIIASWRLIKRYKPLIQIPDQLSLASSSRKTNFRSWLIVNPFSAYAIFLKLDIV